MKSIGELITAANADEGAQPETVLVATPRLYRVTLCVMTFAHVEIVADSPREAMGAAEANPRSASRAFQTRANAHRVEIQRRTNPRDPASPLEWVEVTP